jgi:ribonuclease VapC
MFIDASVIVAILGREPGHEEIEKRMAAAEGSFFVSPLVKFEASVALARQKAVAKTSNANEKPSPELLRQAQEAVDALVEDIGAEELAITPEIGRRAVDASATYGKAVGHVADLNFGDCFAYACAKVLGVALLYKGNDFADTDLA